MTTGERVKRLRKDLDLSADELGKMIGKDRSTIYRYERGDIETATIDVIPHLARALQTTPHGCNVQFPKEVRIFLKQ